MTNKLSWKPIKKGAIYCSSACGGRCTHSAFLSAQKQAKLTAKIVGKGFKPHVWENLGWYWKITSKCECLSVSLYGNTFTAYLNTEPNSGGRWVSEGKTPQIAIKKVIKAARDEMNTIEIMLSKLSNIEEKR